MNLYMGFNYNKVAFRYCHQSDFFMIFSLLHFQTKSVVTTQQLFLACCVILNHHNMYDVLFCEIQVSCGPE